MKYTATVSYPRNPDQRPEVVTADTIEAAEEAAIAQSAVNVTRFVRVDDQRMRTVKGQYTLGPVRP